MLVRYLPILVYFGIIFTTFLAYAFGPVRFVNFNIPLLLSFLLPLFFLTFLGFALGVRGEVNALKKPVVSRDLNKIYYFIVITSIIILCSKWLYFITTKPVSEWLSLGNAYISAYDGYERGAAQLSFGYIYNIIESSLLALAAIICLSSFFDRNPIVSKFLIIFVVFSFAAIPLLNTGKMKYVGDLFIFSFAAFIIAIAQNKINFNFKIFSKLFIFSLIIVSILVFIMSSRYSAGSTDIANIANKIHPLMIWRDNSLLVNVFGDVIGFAVGMLSIYLINGVYGLSICLAMEFKWSYFLGSSYSLGRIVERFVGNTALVDNAYPMRAEQMGWGMDKWHSVYSWIASDFTFPGTLVIAFLIAFMYGRVWLRILQKRNPAASPLFILLTLGMVFSLANNQLLHSLSGVILVTISSILYMLCGKINAK